MGNANGNSGMDGADCHYRYYPVDCLSGGFDLPQDYCGRNQETDKAHTRHLG